MIPATLFGGHHFLSVSNYSPDGHERTLTEIQSDWNQSLRDIELGKAKADVLENPPPENPYRTHWLETSLKAMLTLAARHPVSGIAWLPGKVHSQRFPWANAEGLTGFYDEVVRKAVTKLGKAWGLQLRTTLIFPHENNLVLLKSDNGSFAIYQKSPLKRIASHLPTLQEAESIVAELEEQTEEIPMLFLSEACKSDIREKGLPLLGSVGRRIF